MAEVLSEYLRAAAARPFVWGKDDCATFVIAWMDRQFGSNVLPLWSGLYDSAAGCSDYIERNGGFIAAAKAFSAHFPLAEASPKPGNVVLAMFKGTEAMGIRVDDRDVALRTHHGLIVTARVHVLAEWGAA